MRTRGKLKPHIVRGLARVGLGKGGARKLALRAGSASQLAPRAGRLAGHSRKPVRGQPGWPASQLPGASSGQQASLREVDS